MKILSNRSSLAFIVASALSLFSLSANAGLCIVGQTKEVGTWINPDQNTRGITRAVIGEECRDDSTVSCSGGICTITSGVKLVYTAQLYGSCSPTDCVWDKVDGVKYGSGWLYFKWDQSYADRHIWAKIWSGGDNWLDLVVDTDFDSPSREDYRFRAWMSRQ